MALERALVSRLGHWSLWRLPPVRILLGALTYGIVAWLFAIFRATDLKQAISISASLAGLSGGDTAIASEQLVTAGLLAAAVFALQWRLRDTSLEELSARLPAWLSASVLAAMLVLILTSHGQPRAFIYFQF